MDFRQGATVAGEVAGSGAVRPGDHFGAAFQVELRQKIVHVRFGGAQADAQAARNGLVAQSRAKQVEDLFLTLSQQ